jgi:hypothetical protein
MSPAIGLSNIHAMTLRTVKSSLLLSCLSFLLISCDRAETKHAEITTVSPAGSSTTPSSAAAESRHEALVRAVNAVPYTTAMDVFAGDLVVFDAVGFKSVSRYRALDGKRYAFALRPAGMTNARPLSTNTEGLAEGHYYTVFALPAPGRTALLRVVDDPLARPAAGKSRLRVVHAGDGVGDVDVRIAGVDRPLFERIAFQTVSGYEDVQPVNGPIEIASGGGGPAVVRLANAHLEAGRFYTLVLVGSTQSNTPAEAFIIEDALGTPPATR